MDAGDKIFLFSIRSELNGFHLIVFVFLENTPLFRCDQVNGLGTRTLLLVLNAPYIVTRNLDTANIRVLLELGAQASYW